MTEYKKTKKSDLLKAITENCLNCMTDPVLSVDRSELCTRVITCPLWECPLYKYRLGYINQDMPNV